MVRSVKNALRKILGKTLLRSWELHTILCELEAQINDRPLILLSEDPHDCAPLMPAHFLIGRELAPLPIPAASVSAPTNLSGLPTDETSVESMAGRVSGDSHLTREMD
ncbi:hypothetical protein T4C_9797 [Trichinella pseudospiralis]|uniref:Uncharacterized protein n=1 Tax=Trichinella pseudospiralis TaxID=6337 RepID=A0A0V1JZY8_TRIPS|nr:hypothetical protein T4C_9797 [Trichinella pseudospiralis]